MKRLLTTTISALFGGVLFVMTAAAGTPGFSGTATASDPRPPRILPGPQPHPESLQSRLSAGLMGATDPITEAFSRKNPAAPATMSALPGQINLMGIVLWSTDGAIEGMVRVPQNESHSFVEFNRDVYCTTGAVRQGDTYYLVQYVPNFWRLDTYDPETYELLSRDWDYEGDKYGLFTATSMAYNPADGKVYGCFYSLDRESFEFGCADFANLERTAICTLSNWWHACGFDSQGRLFALDGSGALHQVDTTTGQMTKIGESGVTTQWSAGGALDPETDTFFITTCGENGAYLYSVDLETAAATEIFQFPANEEIVYLHVDEPVAPQEAPAAATDLVADFAQGVDGTVSFNTPDHLYNGQDAEGEVDYIITANGETLLEATAAYASSVTADVTLPSDGRFNISVRLANEVGMSPAVSTYISVGNSAPAMGTVKLTYENNVMKLSWPAAQAADPYAFYDPAQVTYTVVRQPEGEILTEGLTATEFEEEYPYDGELKSVSYEVTACHIDKQSDPRPSNILYIGHIVPPFAEEFEDTDRFNMFTIIDSNGDGKIWQFAGGEARMPYNVYAPMNDWLVTPPVLLEKGRYYKVALDVRCLEASFPERIEVCWGTEATADSLNRELIPPTVVNYNTPRNHYGYIVPEADGFYYVGVHGISDRDEYYLFIDNLVIEDGLPQTAPGLVTDLCAVPDYNGAGEANITFTAPAVDLGGSQLASLDRIEVFRGDSLVITVDPAVAGETYTVTDTGVPSGVTTYAVVGVNADGAGVPVRCETLVGIPMPTAPADITVIEPAPGRVTVSWKAPEVDTYGNPLNPDFVTYTISDIRSGNVWLSDVADTTATFTVSTEGQDMYNFTVTAVTETGSARTSTLLTPVGEPYALPYLESFANASASYTLGTYGDGGQWELYTDSDDMQCADGDNGFIAMRGPVIDCYQMLWTGKISLERAAAPKLSLEVFNFTTDTDNVNTVELQVKTFGSEVSDFETVASARVCDLGDLGWNAMTADLSAYCGKVVSVRFVVTTVSHIYTFIDNIRIFDDLGSNLTAMSLSAPAQVKAGREFEVKLNVANNGTVTAEGWTANLAADGFGTLTADGPALAPGESCNVTFAVTLNSSSRDLNQLSAAVVLDGDENEADNGAEATVNVWTPALQAPAGLTAACDEGEVALSWIEPDAAEIVREESEGFELTDAWSDSVEGWTFVDLDGGMAGGFRQVEIPCLPVGTYGSFWVMDSEFEGFNLTFRSHSGTHFLGGMYNITGEDNDDWAISPELEGGAQTISIYARSYVNPETIQILYSTGSTDPIDFIALTDPTVVPAEWTRFEVELPEGALRFAVRSVSSNNLMLMMDDFTFTPRPAMRDAEFMGYNIYRNGVKLNDTPVSDKAYGDHLQPDTTAEYTVTAVYSNGESGPSEHVTVTSSSAVAAVAVDAASVSVTGHTICVTGAGSKAVSVTAVDGKTVYSSAGAHRHAVEVASGLYIVTVGETSTKVIVR